MGAYNRGAGGHKTTGKAEWRGGGVRGNRFEKLDGPEEKKKRL